VAAAFGRAGFAAPVPVVEQIEPDPDFPTVAFPNPEEPGALDLALERAVAVGADVVIANDPDADRCAVAVPAGGGWRMLRGDEVGVLLADHLIRTGPTRGTFATTIVSSSLLGVLCAARGVPYAESLTGFKWIVRAADDVCFGYEEALGYAVAPHLVRDKDGISAALLVADLAASLRAQGRTLLDRLDEIAAEFGVYATDQISVRVDDLALIDTAMRKLRAAPPTTLLGAAVSTVDDLRPDTDAVRLRTAHARVVVRPSGTEPKLKAYLEVVAPVSTAVPAARAAAAAALTRLRSEIAAALGLG
jgi:phosphomannomutase